MIEGSDPLPPLLQMENKKENVGKNTDEQKPLVPQETFSDSMAIVKKGLRRLWRPNNYRRQLTVKLKSDSTIRKIKSAIPSMRVGKRNKLLFIPFNDILIQYGKNSLTGIYSQKYVDGEKEVFIIEASSPVKIEEWIDNKKEEIKSSIDEAIFSFARKFNIVVPVVKPVWSRHEDWTTDEEIKEIPEWTVIQGDHMKKVYPEGVEYMGGKDKEPVEQLINRVRNTGLKDVSPELVEVLEMLIDKIVVQENPLEFLKSVIKFPSDVLNYPEHLNILSTNEKELLSEFIFERFGGVGSV